MPAILFHHDNVDPPDLTVSTGANQISWGYNLNTQAYPTYAGEVVQVLSTNIDDLQIQGQIKTYKEMENIYSWFLQYMLKATQGYAGGNYNEKPVVMQYPERGWTLSIKPIAMPAMRYGRDVVIPEWRLRASIVDPDPAMDELTVDNAANDAKNQLVAVGRMTADIGYRRKNPFSDPIAVITKEESELYPRAKGLAGITVEGSGQTADKPTPKGIAAAMNKQFEALMGGQFSELTDQYNFDGSKPALIPTQEPDNTDKADTTKPGK